MAAPPVLYDRTPGLLEYVRKALPNQTLKTQEESWPQSPAPTSALTSHTRHRGASRLEPTGK